MNMAFIAVSLAVVCVATAARGEAPAVFGDHFARRDAASYLANAGKLKPTQAKIRPAPGDGGNVLTLEKETVAEFKPVPVDENVKYRLSFGVRVKGVETIEENPRLSGKIFAKQSWLPTCRALAFFDRNMKPVGPSGGGTPEFGLPFGTWFDFQRVFYPPRGAAFMQLTIDTRKAATVFLRNMSLETAPDEGAINVNPVFAHGKYDYSGWGSSVGCILLERHDGRVLFDSRYGSGGESFPLQQAGAYRLFAKGTTYGGYSDVILHFVGEDGKTLSTVSLHTTPKGTQKDFVLPAGTVRGRFLVYNNILEELRLTRLGEETMIR